MARSAPHPWDRATRFPGEWEPRQTAKVAATPDRVWSEPSQAASRIAEDRQGSPRWFKASFGGAALLGALLLVVWAQHGAGSACALSFDFARPLRLDRPVDREHLAADAASVVRAARRYAAGSAGEERQRRFLECEDVLVSEIAARHAVSADQVRAAARYGQ
jgi:hypothetical protein